MNDLKEMYKKVSTYDLFILITIVLVVGMLNFEYVLPCVLGLVVAIGNFIISGFATNDAVEKNKVSFTTYFSVTLKVFSAGAIGAILLKNNKYYIFPFLGGYISHFISLIVYGLSLKNK